MATGFIFALLYWHYGLSPELGIMAFYVCLFTIIFVVDLEHGLILNKVVYPSIAVSLLLAIFLPQPWLTRWIAPGVANAAIGGGIGFVLFFLLAIASRGGMGWGDVKLAGLIGLASGFPLIIVAIFLAVVSGGLVAVILLLSKIKKRKEPIPFGPFLALAAMATLLWGSDILHWYLSASKLPIP